LAYFDEEPVEGGHVCVSTKNRMRVEVVRVTPKRVYFYHEGRRTFANKKNCYVVKRVRVQ
jgi:hypothetical protein